MPRYRNRRFNQRFVYAGGAFSFLSSHSGRGPRRYGQGRRYGGYRSYRRYGGDCSSSSSSDC